MFIVKHAESELYLYAKWYPNNCGSGLFDAVFIQKKDATRFDSECDAFRVVNALIANDYYDQSDFGELMEDK